MSGRKPPTLAGDLAGPPLAPRFRPIAEIAFPLGVAGLLTWWARASGIDLGAESWIHRIGGGSWSLGEHPFWKWLYYAGTIPAALVVFAAVSAFALSWKKEILRPWRRVFVFLVLAGVVGSGLITNAILKEYWGRPRPRELVQFGGRCEFEPVLSYDASSEGLSFPCGHATMGFYFLAFYFLLRRHRPGLAQTVVFASLSLGGLMGIARMTQGAHFFSDVVSAAVVCWFTPMGLYHAMGLDRRLVRESDAVAKAMPWPLKIGLSLAGSGMLAAVLLATPYEEKRTYTLMNEFVKDGPLAVRLQLTSGDVEISPGEEFRIEAEANGHGIPTSKVGRFYEEADLPEGGSVLYAERISGWFKEVNPRLRIELPWHRIRILKIDTGETEVRLKLAGKADRPVIQILSGSGSVTLSPNGQHLRWIPGSDPRVTGPGLADAPMAGASPYRIELGDEFRGSVDVATMGVP